MISYNLMNDDIIFIMSTMPSELRRALHGSKLSGLELIVDPRDETIERYAAAQFWTHCRKIEET